MHTSHTLLHLDISCMQLSVDQLQFIARLGLRKARTILSVHMNNTGFSFAQLEPVRKALKVKEYSPGGKGLVTLDHDVLAKLVHPPAAEGGEALEHFSAKQATNLKRQAQTAIREPLLPVEESQSCCFERNLGRLEILGAHRWRQVSDKKCQICRKETHCLFAWNKRISRHYHLHHKFW